jgi:hypothetical protein
MHLKESRQIICNEVLAQAVGLQNFKLVKLILRKMYKDIKPEFFSYLLANCAQLSIHGKNFIRSINKYNNLASFENKNLTY